MNNIIYIRPIVPEDAKTSFKWRNKPEIWKYTKFKTDCPITLEKELRWLLEVLERKDQIRFAICISATHEYIGNVHLINITETEAEFHLLIGNDAWWGKGIGEIATDLMITHAFLSLNLQKIILEVHVENFPAISIYKKCGFIKGNINSPFAQMELTQSNFKRSKSYEKNYFTFSER